MSAPIGRLTFRTLPYSKYLFANIRSSICNRTETCRRVNTRELKKFYKNATVVLSDGWYEINLDKRKLRTPHGQLFRVPTEALALAVATEWNSQDKLVQRHSMHLTALCNTALDNPTHRTKGDLIRNLLHYLETDTLCYRMTEPSELAKLQQQEWDPVINWLEKRYRIEIPCTTGISGPSLPHNTIQTLDRHFMQQHDWALYGYVFAVETVKSLVLTMALVDRHITVERAVDLSRLEQTFQTRQWGNVEWYHDVDLYEVQSRLSAATLFSQWCSESETVQKIALVDAGNT